MRRSTRKLLYTICVVIVIIAFVVYSHGYPYIEGFQKMQTSPLFTDAYVITLDKYPDRLSRIKANAEAAGMSLKKWSGVIVTKEDAETLPQRGIGTILFQDRTETYFNFGVIGCFLAHRGLLEHIASKPNGIGTFICEDDIDIPKDFYAKLSAVSSEIPDDWDYIFMRKYIVKSHSVTTHIQRLEKDLTSSKNIGMWGFIVKNSSIKTKILPVLENMTDAVDLQLAKYADKINMYLIDPPIINMDISHNDSIIKDMDEQTRYEE